MHSFESHLFHFILNHDKPHVLKHVLQILFLMAV